ncbi:hypothetical protein F183_A28990 [Bryobacterales bacterium F-183]|nr:hypothetical protein F183_A28990 [Bryobacterales bacterium F-183]
MSTLAVWLANQRPVRAALWLASLSSAATNAISSITGVHGVFPSFDAGWAAARRFRTTGHEHPDQASRILHKQMRTSDYPVLFLLAVLQPRQVLDFGGSIGNLFYLYRTLLPNLDTVPWTVVDLPEVVDQGRALALERNASNLTFTDHLSNAPTDTDFLLAAGCFHYWERSVSEFFQALSSLPSHVLINRVPVTSRREDYVIVQSDHILAVPCIVRNRARFIADVCGLGYELVDSWEEPRASHRMLFLPAYTVRSFSGFYFRRTPSRSI